MRHVQDLEGAHYFARPDWERQLRGVAERALQDHAVSYETREEQWAAICWETDTSRRTMEERLGLGEVEDFCYPWGEGSEIAVAASRKAGYRSNVWGRTWGGPWGLAARRGRVCLCRTVSPPYAYEICWWAGPRNDVKKFRRE